MVPPVGTCGGAGFFGLNKRDVGSIFHKAYKDLWASVAEEKKVKWSPRGWIFLHWMVRGSGVD